ncbi:type I restriction enzyme S subunit [Pantoea ananatis]|uniref:restriction endonuclease subunit S n=1 Tax=Pantoea ananas TaxID=553 RepID=UPI000D757E78|nr:restriction endonuclease subunit S [Pantoea ananatis]PXW01479.1 type I restriction enzyme S subunit [Pantoea ananatis]
MYKKYTEYKPSGIDWVSAIPKSWEVLPAFIVVKDVCIKNVDGVEDNVLSLSYGNIVKRNLDDNFGLLPESFNTYQIVSEGNIVLRLTDLQNDKKSLRVGYVNEKGIITSAYLNLACLKYLESRYAYFLLHSYDLTKVFYGMGGGLRQSMKFEDLKRLPIIIPSYSEQLSIVQFLEAETAKIDQLISKQEKLIELLKEKRQAVISHAVTKGLNSDVEMKYSCVEWLGDIPEHWSIVKFSYCVSIRSGLVDPKSEQYKKYWLIAPNHIQSGEGRILYLETAEEQGAESSKYLCKKGEVIYSKIRPALAKVCISPENNVLCSADMYPMTARSGLTNDYLSWFLLSSIFTRFAVNQADRVAMPKINRESLAECKIPFPEKSEQIEIAYYLQRITKKLDDLIVKSQESIFLLKERRSALISAAVTGKIDVRNWQSDAKDAA